MSLTASVTPGKAFTESELITVDGLNLLGQPTIDIVGAVGSATLADSSVTTAKIADGNVTADKMAGGLILPVGCVIAFAAATAPAGWLECNGQCVLIATYTALHDIIYIGAYSAGMTFGYRTSDAGGTTPNDGGAYIKVPDLRGEFVRGWDHSRGIDAARALAYSQADALKSHTHDAGYKTLSLTVGGTTVEIPEAFDGNNGLVTSGPSTGAATETRPRNVALMYCIKY